MHKQSRIIILIICLIISMTIGYSIYSQTLDTEGITALTGNFDVSFYKIGEITEYECSGTTAYITDDKNMVKIDIPNMKKKGSYVIIPITVKNDSTMSVRLLSIEESKLPIDSLITVNYYGIAASDAPLEPDETSTLYVKVEWEKGTALDNSQMYFDIRLNYIQSK